VCSVCAPVDPGPHSPTKGLSWLVVFSLCAVDLGPQSPIIQVQGLYWLVRCKAVNRGDKRSRRYRYRDFAKFERSRRSVRPRQHGERRLLRLAHFHCAFCTPPPPSAQGEGGGRSVSKLLGNIGGHQVCPPTTLSSL
jgi:hypothetical protein